MCDLGLRVISFRALNPRVWLKITVSFLHRENKGPNYDRPQENKHWRLVMWLG